MPKRLIRTDLDGLEKEPLTQTNIPPRLSLSNNQNQHANGLSTVDMLSYNYNNTNFNINNGNQHIYTIYGNEPFLQQSSSTANQVTCKNKRKVILVPAFVSCV